MKSTAEIEIKIEGVRIKKANVVTKDGVCKLMLQMLPEIKKVGDTFWCIEASKLSLNDSFMDFNPQDAETKEFKDELTEVIKKGVRDFYRPIMDPSFDEDGISFKKGKIPAIGKSYDWWEKTVKEFMPERHVRIGNKSEYIAFLGYLIKTLVDEDWPIADAWNAVCRDSIELGYYWNSVSKNHDFALTGSVEVCGFYDLANTYKMLAEDDNAGGFWLAGGYCGILATYRPLAHLEHVNDREVSYPAVGWLVF